MKQISEFLTEKLKLSQYREYYDTKPDDRAKAWLDAFFERVKLQPDAKVSHNGHRIYFPFALEAKDIDLGTQQLHYNAEAYEISDMVKSYLMDELNIDVKEWDYLHGKYKYEIQTQRGPKLKEMSIGKSIKKNKKLTDLFASDPLRLSANLADKKLEIVLSNHSYDLAGMSTDRNWTSCMDIAWGKNAKWIKEDIKWGTVIAYLIDSKDENINAPLGRICIKPYKIGNGNIYYFPEPTVYSPYVGLDSVKKFLDDLCIKIQGEIDELYRITRDEMEADGVDISDAKDIGKISQEKLKYLTRKGLVNDKDKYILYYDDLFAKNKNVK